jgi:hypothetical protein
MTTFAGSLTTTVQANPQWKAANGGVYYVLDPTQSFRTITPGDLPARGWRQDYWRRTGRWGRRWGLGPIGFRFAVPYDAGGTYKVSLATDSTETALTPPVYTVMNPPPGSGIK